MHRPLTQHDLLPGAPLGRLGRSIQVFTEVGSTNAYLLANATKLPDGAVAYAEYQNAGRGRLGRSWVAPRGSSIMLSILFFEPDGSPLIEHAGMLAAVAAAQAIEDETSCTPALRWPNDLIVDGRKLAGVLAETSPLGAGAAQQRALVVGIGINCFQHAGHFAGELTNIATSLELVCPEPIARAAVAAALLRRLDAAFQVSGRTEQRWAELRREWASRCEDLGARVRLVEGGRDFSGVILEIADNGDLLVQLDDGGRRQFSSATVTRVV